MLTQVSNYQILPSGSLSFRLSDCTHATFISFPGWDMSNDSVGTVQRTWNTQNIMLIRTALQQMKKEGLQCTQFFSSRQIHAKYIAPRSIQHPPPSSELSSTRGSRHNSTIQQRQHRTRKGSVEEQQIEWLHKQQTSSGIGEIWFRSPKTDCQEAPKEKAASEKPPPIYRRLHRYTIGSDEPMIL